MGLLSRLRELNGEIGQFNEGIERVTSNLGSAAEAGRRFQDNVDVPNIDTGAGGQGSTQTNGQLIGSQGPVFGSRESGAAGGTQPILSNIYTPNTSQAGSFGTTGDKGVGGGGGGGSKSFNTSGMPPWWGDAPDWVKTEWTAWKSSGFVSDVLTIGGVSRPSNAGLSKNARDWIRDWYAANQLSGTSSGGVHREGEDRTPQAPTRRWGGSEGDPNPGSGSNFGSPLRHRGQGGGGSGESGVISALQDLGTLQQTAIRVTEEQTEKVVGALRDAKIINDGGAGNRANGLV